MSREDGQPPLPKTKNVHGNRQPLGYISGYTKATTHLET